LTEAAAASKATARGSVSPNPVIRHASATASANASDGLSDLDSSSCDVVDTSTLGSGQTVTCYARDNAGNTSQANATYTVILSVIGSVSIAPST
jgi:hypothetical protein